MRYYFVKRQLYGVSAGTVERFTDTKAGPLMLSGDIEPYDPKRHAGKPGAPPIVPIARSV